MRPLGQNCRGPVRHTTSSGHRNTLLPPTVHLTNQLLLPTLAPSFISSLSMPCSLPSLRYGEHPFKDLLSISLPFFHYSLWGCQGRHTIPYNTQKCAHTDTHTDTDTHTHTCLCSWAYACMTLNAHKSANTHLQRHTPAASTNTLQPLQTQTQSFPHTRMHDIHTPSPSC